MYILYVRRFELGEKKITKDEYVLFGLDVYNTNKQYETTSNVLVPVKWSYIKLNRNASSYIYGDSWIHFQQM